MPPYCIACNKDLAGDKGATITLCGTHASEQVARENRERSISSITPKDVLVVEYGVSRCSNTTANNTYCFAITGDVYSIQGALQSRALREEIRVRTRTWYGKDSYGERAYITSLQLPARSASDTLLRVHKQLVSHGWRGTPEVPKNQRLINQYSSGGGNIEIDATRLKGKGEIDDYRQTVFYLLDPEVLENYYWELYAPVFYLDSKRPKKKILGIF